MIGVTEESRREEQAFAGPRHEKYWLRCLQTLLPTLYTEQDSQRLTLAYFILSALDLLSILEKSVPEPSRTKYVDWIYSFQHPDGGFGVEPCHAASKWRNAQLASTHFALMTLLILGDDLARVEHIKCFEWLTRLQLSNGSFGESLSNDGTILCGQDVRFCYMAASIRRLLRLRYREMHKDINVPRLISFVASTRSYEGAHGQSPGRESHAGCTFCAVATLKLLESLGQSEQVIRWLAHRQTVFFTDWSDGESSDKNDTSVTDCPLQREDSGLEPRVSMIGANGRCNKIADTCYVFWIGAAAEMLERPEILAQQALKRFLLEKTQHLIGGFGKVAGDPPDMLHSYLGLAALSLLRQPGLRPVDPCLCLSEARLQAFVETCTEPR